MTDINICPVCLAPVTCHREKAGDREHVSVRYKAPRWIPVTEKLPEKYEQVLVAVPYEDDVVQQVALLTEDGEWCVYGAGMIRHEVTHWMPLPEPPKEDD